MSLCAILKKISNLEKFPILIFLSVLGLGLGLGFVWINWNQCFVI